ncbi:hypothetical protein ACFQPG_09085 [Sphingomonas sp. GCM10030256]|uniref:hypothetical protein n=1 Tax=Sphingomonas sp. GCM10030256 TaxID=3273427 RepID=UPI0036128E5F
MNLPILPSAIAVLLLSACDPGVHVGWEKDFDGRVDDECVERALKTVSPEVTRTTYVSEGSRGFPRGTVVTQFNYPDPVTHNGYSLDVALLSNGKTHLVHEWSKIGTDIPAEEQAQILPLLHRANKAVVMACGLSFMGSPPEVGPG